VYGQKKDVSFDVHIPHTPLGKGEKLRIRPMQNNEPIESGNQGKETSMLDEVIREGARRLL